MWHGAFITLHAIAGVIAFGAGCSAVVRRRWFAIFWWSLVAMVVFLAAAVGVEWPSLDAASRALFTGLLGLGGWMLWRASAARRMLRHAPRADEEEGRRYVGHLAFDLVALFDAFVVITVLNGGAPGWASALAGIAVAGAGHVVVNGMRRGFALRSAISERAQSAESAVM